MRDFACLLACIPLAGILQSGCSGSVSQPVLLLDVAQTEFRGGEARTHVLQVPASHQVIRIELTQGLVDCLLSVETPQAGQTLTVNSPGEHSRPDLLTFRVSKPGRHVIIVRPLASSGVRGTYALRVWRLPTSTAAARSTIRGELLLTAAASQFANGTEAGWRESLDLYAQAASAFSDAGLRAQAARSRLLASLVAFTKLTAWGRAAGDAREALDDLTAVNDLTSAALAARIAASALLELAPSASASNQTEDGTSPWRECAALFDRALELSKRIDDPVERALTVNQRGALFFYMHDYEAARAAWIEARTLAHSAGFVLGELKAAQNLAFLDYELGSLEPAAESMDRVAALLEATGTDTGLADTLDNSAEVYSTLGRADESLRRYFRALTLHRRSDDGAGMARSLHGIGNAYLRAGDPARGLGFFQQALPLRQAHNDSRGLVSTLLAISAAHDMRGQLSEARASLQQALNASHTPQEQAKSLLALSRLELRSQRPSRAREWADRVFALKIAEPHSLLDQARLARGKARMQLGEHALADADLDAARQRFIQAHEIVLEIEALLALAATRESGGLFVDALSVLDQALARIEQVRERAVNPDLRARYLASQAESFQARIDLLMKLAARSPSDSERAERTIAALLSADRVRARTLQDARINSVSDAAERAHPADRRSRDLLDRLAAAYLRLDRLRERGGIDPDFLRAQEQELRLMRAELDLLQGQRGVSSLGSALDAPELRRLQRRLPPSTGIVVYALGTTHSWAWVVRRDAIDAVRLAPRATIEKLAHAYHADESSILRSGPVSRGSGEKLSGTVIAPLLSLLPGERVLFALDGALHYVPLAALPVPASNNGSATYLAKRFEISVFGSLAQLAAEKPLNSQRPPAWRRELLLVADPVFSAGDPRVRRPALQARVKDFTGSARIRSMDQSLPPLPGTAAEARGILPLFAGGDALALQGFEATRARFLAELALGARVIHLATHAYADTREPRLSYIALAGVDRRGEPINGALLTGEIANTSTNAELVTLSGCDTHIGEQVFGEGLRGLSHAWIQAGARTVIGSLWRIDDEATQALMRHFYMKLDRSDERPAAALRAAQLAALAEDRYAQPHYWAAFLPVVTTVESPR